MNRSVSSFSTINGKMGGRGAVIIETGKLCAIVMCSDFQLLKEDKQMN